MHNWIWVFSQKNLQFYKLSCYPQFYHIYDRSNFSILNENVSSSLLDYILIGFVWLPLYLWKLAQKFSIFKFFPMNFPYLKICSMKSSVLAENVSTSLFNCILIVFVCLSLYLRFFQKNLQFYELSYVILNFIIHMLEENIIFHRKMSPLLFTITF